MEDLFVADKFQNIVVDDISLDVRAGEIVGIAGVQGNGQTELVEAITGLQKPLSGVKIILLGEDITKVIPARNHWNWALHMSPKTARRWTGAALPDCGKPGFVHLLQGSLLQRV